LSFKRMWWAAVCLSMIWTSSQAQERRKNEIGLLLGGTVTPNVGLKPTAGEVSVSTGLTLQATFARELVTGRVASLYLEVPFVATPLQDVSSSSSSVPANYASLFIAPGCRVKLAPGAPLSPWFSVGAGYARFDESAERVDGSPSTNPIGTNRGVAQFGAGLDVRTPVKVLFPVGLRVEVRDFYSGKPNYGTAATDGYQHNVVFSGGFALHF
jgi:hypothetical protein